VHYDQGRPSDHLKAAGPSCPVEAVAYGGLPGTEGARRGGGEKRIARLEHAQHAAAGIVDPPVRAFEIEPPPVPRRLAHAHPKIATLRGERHAGVGGPANDHSLRLRGLTGGDGDTAPDDGRLLVGNRLERIPEVG